jgi:hypothetical protein
MKLSLFCKDATVIELGSSDYRFVFDLSKFNIPRLSKNTRMYIENVNLPIFKDPTFSTFTEDHSGNFRGYFEMMCDNIDNENNISTSDNNTSKTMIFTHPFENNKSIINPDPMHMYNYKVNQNFLNQNFTLELYLYDDEGNPFTTQRSRKQEKNKTSTEYASYLTKLVELNGLVNHLQTLDPIIEQFEKDLVDHINFEETTRIEMETRIIDIEKLNISSLNVTPIRIQVMMIFILEIINSGNLKAIIYLFEKTIENIINLSTNASLKKFKLNDYYIVFDQNQIHKNNIETTRSNIQDLQISNNIIYYNIDESLDPIFDNTNTSHVIINSQKYNNIDYTINAKTGKIDFEVHMTENNFQVHNIKITPTDNTSTHLIVKNDELKILKTALIPFDITPYKYIFIKDIAGSISNIILTGSVDEQKNKFINMEIIRTGTIYTININESSGFNVGDTINVNGEFLGGITGTNNFQLSVGSTDVVSNDISFNLIDYIDESKASDNKFDIVVKKVNNDGLYSITSFDFTKNLNEYAINETILIEGSVLGGENVTNDLMFEVSEISKVLTTPIIINNTTSTYKMNFKIDNTDTGVIIKDSSDTVKTTSTFTNLKIVLDGSDQYIILVDELISDLFEANDTVLIPGTLIGGVNTTNDLLITISEVDVISPIVSGPIKTLVITSGLIPAKITNYAITISSLKKDKTGVFIDALSFTSIGDIPIAQNVIITASVIAPISHEFSITITSIVGGVPNFTFNTVYQTIDLSIGKIEKLEILSTTINNGLVIKVIGEILTSNILTPSAAINIGAINVASDIILKINDIDTQGKSKYTQNVVDKNIEIDVTKSSIPYTNSTSFLSFSTQQKKQMRQMNITMVLYDEEMEIKQDSYDAINGNTYSRLRGCQHRRI